MINSQSYNIIYVIIYCEVKHCEHFAPTYWIFNNPSTRGFIAEYSMITCIISSLSYKIMWNSSKSMMENFIISI